MERKIFTPFNIRELNTKNDKNDFIVEGYATTFDEDGYNVFDYIDDIGFIEFNETFERGAFSKSITARCGSDKKNGIRMLHQHRHSEPLGIPELEEDEKGLYFKCAIPRGKTLNDDIIIDIKNGVLKQISIGFNMNEYQLSKNEAGEYKVRHTDVYLWELSLVTFSANENAMLTKNRSNANIYQMIKNYGEKQVREVLNAMTNTDETLKPKTAMTNNVFEFTPLIRKSVKIL